jgi:hypothetical protein
MRSDGSSEYREEVHGDAPEDRSVVFVGVAGLVLLLTRSPLYAAEVALGPFAGAAAREWAPHYVEKALGLLPYAGGAVFIGVLVQLLVPDSSRASRWVRGTVRGLAVATWFLFAVYAYLEALE